MPTQEELVTEAREAFTLFDKDSSGSIKTKDLGVVLRSLGFSLSQTELDEIEKIADPESLNFIKVDKFLELVKIANEKSTESQNEAKKILTTFPSAIHTLLGGNAGDEWIEVSLLRRVLTRAGEKLSQDEFAELMKELDIENGKIKLDNFINNLIL